MGHPQLLSNVQEVFESIRKGAPVMRDDVHVVTKIYHHHLSYPIAGQSSPFQFFNANLADGIVSNWVPLGTNQAFLLGNVFVDVEPACTTSTSTTGAYGTATAAYLTAASASGTVVVAPDVVLDAENKKRILKNGRIELKIGTYNPIDEYGLQNWPSGMGPDGTAGLSVSGAFTAANNSASGAGSVNNGQAFIANRRMVCPGGYPVWPGENVLGKVTFPTAIPIATVTGRISMYMFGILVEG